MDETPTVIRKSGAARSKDAVNRAMASGEVEVTRKATAATNKGNVVASQHLAKIENDTETFKVATVDRTVARALTDARAAKNMTQKQLATLVNEKPQVIQELESGKAQPNHAVLGKLERYLKVHLRGSKIGQPM